VFISNDNVGLEFLKLEEWFYLQYWKMTFYKIGGKHSCAIGSFVKFVMGQLFTITMPSQAIAFLLALLQT
jgi:hypothetical protein